VSLDIIFNISSGTNAFLVDWSVKLDVAGCALSPVTEGINSSARDIRRDFAIVGGSSDASFEKKKNYEDLGLVWTSHPMSRKSNQSGQSRVEAVQVGLKGSKLKRTHMSRQCAMIDWVLEEIRGR
jgi:hypothetical protein